MQRNQTNCCRCKETTPQLMHLYLRTANQPQHKGITMTTQTTEQPVEKQVSDAYCDVMMLNNITSNEAYELRNLHFRATKTVTRWEAIEILTAYVPEYSDGDNWEPKQLLALPEDAQITIAREYSVCIYVKGNITFCKSAAKMIEQLKCNENDYNPETNETRLCWC